MIGALLTTKGLYLGGKAIVAQILLDKAWATTLQSGQDTPPWAWMDTVPIAKLTVPATQNSAIILNTLSGQALAFGPAHMTKTPLPGEPGISVIAAHKNTHFSFLQDLRTGDEIEVQRADGRSYTFIMTGADIVHKDNSGIPDIQTPGQLAQLALVTCYPFNAVSFGGPMRYVVYGRLKTSDVLS
jgi:sortase A